MHKDSNNNLVPDSIESKIATEKMKDEFIRTRVRWIIRRRLALSAFIYNLVVGLLYFIIIFFLDKSQADMLKDFNSIMISIIGANFSIVMLYIGAVTYSDTLADNRATNSDTKNLT